MVVQQHELWWQTRDQKEGKRSIQFHEDSFEMAVEEASLNLLHSVCNIFRKGVASSCLTQKLPRGCAENLQKMQTKQLAESPFSSASLTFTPGNKLHPDNDAENDMQRVACGNENKVLAENMTCASINGNRHVGHGRDATRCGALEPFNHSATATGPRNEYQHNGDAGSLSHRGLDGPFSQLATASLIFAPINKFLQEEYAKDFKQEINYPSVNQLLKHPLALLSYISKDVSLFFAGAVAGATAKTVTAPLDRIKLLMQVHGVKATQEITKKSIGFLEAAIKIGKEEGIQGYWKGNLPQVVRVIPYSAVQLLSYELYKKLFKGSNKELPVAGRLAAGACAGMTSTLVTYPLDVLRLRLAVDPASKSMVQVASNMLREEGLSSFYRGLGPSLLGIAPYIALNFCAFDLIKKSLPEEVQKTPVASFLTAVLSASLATTLCYPLDTVRRQLQMKGTPYLTVLDAFPGITAKDGVLGLYRGFVPNALKNLPNSSIRLTTFDAAKNLISASQQEFQRLLDERRNESRQDHCPARQSYG